MRTMSLSSPLDLRGLGNGVQIHCNYREEEFEEADSRWESGIAMIRLVENHDPHQSLPLVTGRPVRSS